MASQPQLLGLLILACSVNLFAMPEGGSQMYNSYVRRTRQERRTPSGSWSNPSTRNHSRSTMNDGSDPFVFPEDTDKDSSQRFVPKFGKKTPECAKGSTFCENVEDYPSKYLENVLQDSGVEFRVMFGNDLVNDLSIIHRIDAADENPLCPSVEQVVYPKSAKNKDDQWLYVVNQGQYKQGIRIEKCHAPDDPPQSCAFTEGFPIGYKTFCKQKFIYRRLIALNENGKTVTDTFQIPSCCACIVKAEGLRSRVGSPQQKVTPADNSTKSN